MLLKRRRPGTTETSMDLPMTPMIDVIFQLLIFFMCSLHFKDVEAKLTAMLPKDIGLSSASAKPNPNEIRIRLAVDPARTTIVTAGLLTAHERIGILTRSTPNNASISRTVNGGVYALLRDRLSVWHRQASQDPKLPPRVIIDAAEEVPYEHVIGAMNACMEADIPNIEFTAHPEHARRFQRR